MSDFTDIGAARILAHLEGFTEGERHTRQEIEAAVEIALQTSACGCQETYCASRNGAETIRRAVRRALSDPAVALADHDTDVRVAWTEELCERLRGREC